MWCFLLFRQYVHSFIKSIVCCCRQDYARRNENVKQQYQKHHLSVTAVHRTANQYHEFMEEFFMKSNLRNEIKSYIVRQGMTMQEVVDLLADEYGWSDSVSNLSNKLQRESLRYTEALQLAEVLGFEIVWRKRGDR